MGLIMKLFCNLILSSLILLVLSCSGQPILDQEGCLPGTPFILGPDGGEFELEQWVFSVKPGDLKEATLFTAKQCPAKDFNHKITHQFIGTESEDIVTVEATHPIDPDYPTIKIELNNKNIPEDSLELTACQTANPGDDARQLIVTNQVQALIPIFGVEPTAMSKCYAVEFSLAADDQAYTAWFSTLQSAFDKVKTYSGETLSQYMAYIEKFANEKYEKHISTCYACKISASYLIDKFTCSGQFVGDFKKLGCMAAIGTISAGVGTLFSGVICSGFSYLFDQLSGKIAGTTLTKLCNTAAGIDIITNNLKSEVCSICNTYMPTYNCTVDDNPNKQCPKLDCKDIFDEGSCKIDPQGCIWKTEKCAKK